MANREEILKKINLELNKLSDEELEQVAGGNAEQTSNDSRFLNSLNGSTDRYGPERIAWSFGIHNAEIEKGWATVGIKATVYFACGGFGKSNRYYLNGREISQEEARQHAMEVTQHYMTEKDWKW
ncbi:MAG: hypothetical protein IKN43_06775 [Selenomonadaceae bacterium]|nr:hypothetical protein [Selenomonadaceae bacterium]